MSDNIISRTDNTSQESEEKKSSKNGWISVVGVIAFLLIVIGVIAGDLLYYGH